MHELVYYVVVVVVVVVVIIIIIMLCTLMCYNVLNDCFDLSTIEIVTEHWGTRNTLSNSFHCTHDVLRFIQSCLPVVKYDIIVSSKRMKPWLTLRYYYTWKNVLLNEVLRSIGYSLG